MRPDAGGQTTQTAHLDTQTPPPVGVLPHPRTVPSKKLAAAEGWYNHAHSQRCKYHLTVKWIHMESFTIKLNLNGGTKKDLSLIWCSSTADLTCRSRHAFFHWLSSDRTFSSEITPSSHPHKSTDIQSGRLRLHTNPVANKQINQSRSEYGRRLTTATLQQQWRTCCIEYNRMLRRLPYETVSVFREK